MIAAARAWLAKWAVALMAGVAVAGWVSAGIQTVRLARLQAKVATDLAAATQKARERENEWSQLWRENEDAKRKAKDAVDAQLADALRRLRDRPQRMPEAARAACQGTTGRELSGPDAEFLVGLAARADGLRAELAACYQREDALTGRAR